jgi:hypothetical protein
MWAAEIPRAIHKKSLNPQKMGVWYTLSRININGPIFFKTTVNIDTYLGIFHEFMNHLNDRDV